MLPKHVKITKSVNRKVGDIEYYKHIVTIPNKHLKDLKWTDKTNLKMEVKGKKLVIEKE